MVRGDECCEVRGARCVVRGAWCEKGCGGGHVAGYRGHERFAESLKICLDELVPLVMGGVGLGGDERREGCLLSDAG